MPLYIDATWNSEAAFFDLMQIVRCDTGLGQDLVAGDPTVQQVTYQLLKTSPMAVRLQALVNSSAKIVIHAVESWATLPTGGQVSSVGGATIFQPKANGQADTSIPIHVYYDFNTAYYVYDVNGNKISNPRSVILYHELAHAFHAVSGNLTIADPEVQAETDENVYRKETGLSQRNPNNHIGGIGASNGEDVKDCTTNGLTNFWDGVCFIVSAVHGEHSPQVARLKATRDRLAETSPVLGMLVAEAMREYYRFSPIIAATMACNPAYRAAIARWFVAPLLHFEAALAGLPPEARLPDLMLAMAASAEPVAAHHALALAEAAAALADRLVAAQGSAHAAPPWRALDPDNPASVFGHVGDHVVASGPAPHIAWIAGVLEVYWTGRAAAAGHGPEALALALALPARLDAWLAAVPFTRLPDGVTEAALAADLDRLGRVLVTDPGVRARLAQRCLGTLAPDQTELARRGLAAAGWLSATQGALA